MVNYTHAIVVDIALFYDGKRECWTRKETRMNRMMLGTVTIAVGALVGCSTVDPLSIPQTVRDMQTYKADVTRKLPTERYKIAILSKAIPHARDKEFDTFLANEVESSLANNFTNLGVRYG